MSQQSDKTSKVSKQDPKAYWRANIRLLLSLLVVWFAVSFGAGVLFVDELNAYSFMGFPLGFWFAQQGSIYVFVILIFIYTRKMKAIEHEHGVEERDSEVGDAS